MAQQIVYDENARRFDAFLDRLVAAKGSLVVRKGQRLGRCDDPFLILSHALSTLGHAPRWRVVWLNCGTVGP
ncbi:hypothetical protein ABTB97_22060, partial [Acinetobacter baumannii]